MTITRYKNYQEAATAARKSGETFWETAAEKLSWSQTWDKTLDTIDSPHNIWFRGGKCNICYNTVDRHVEAGRGSATAIIYDSAMIGAKEKISYKILQERVAKTAGMLKNLGVQKGDRVVIYMPMIPETIYAMLGCARIGAVHSVVFGGFAAAELSSRLADSQAGVLLTATCGYEPGRKINYFDIVEESLKMENNEGSKSLAKVVVFDRGDEQTSTHFRECSAKDSRYENWHNCFNQATMAPCVFVNAEDPLYILYTSGSTGKPKGVERATGGHMVALSWSMDYIYDCKAGDVFWAASDFGWIVGHSYIVYGPLIAGCTTVVYEGKPVKTPDPGAFFRIIEDYKVNVMFTAPTAFRAIRREDPEGKYCKLYDISSLRSQFLAGERCDTGTLEWVRKILGVPVIDHWWQTETGWAITANFLGFDERDAIVAGSAGLAVPGYDIRILGSDHQELPRGEMGDVCVKLPMPPSFMTGLWGARERFVATYMSKHLGYYTTGDAGYMDEKGYLFIMARTDDVINVAGHRLSTSGIEETLISHPGVVEAAAVGKNDSLKGQVPVAFVVAAPEYQAGNLAEELVIHIREKMGAVTALRQVFVVEQLPKTRSGKILRGTIQKIVNEEPYKVSPTIENLQAIDTICEAVKKRTTVRQ